MKNHIHQIIYLNNWIWIFALLSILVSIGNSACSSSNVFPLLYGTGSYVLKIYDMAETGTDIVVVGQSKINNANGEGFVMKIDQYGKILWQKLYRDTTSTSDKIDKVAIDSGSSTIFLAGTSTTSSTNAFFALKLATDGTLSYNLKIGTSTSYVSNTASITDLVAIDSSTIGTFFQVPSVATRASYSKDTFTAGVNAQVYKFNSGWSTSVYSLYKVVGTRAYVILGYSNYLILFSKDTSNSATNGGAGTNVVQAKTDSTNVYLYDSDWKSDSSEVWIVYPSTTTTDMAGILFTTSSIPTPTKLFKVTFSAAYSYAQVSYVDSNSCYIYVLVGSTGIIGKVDQSTTTSPTISTKEIASLSNTHFMGKVVTGGILMASALVGGESASFTNEQGIIWKASTSLAFNPLGCYETSAGSQTIANVAIGTPLSISSTTTDSRMSEITTSSVAQVLGTDSYFSTTSSIVIRAQSTKNKEGTSDK